MNHSKPTPPDSPDWVPYDTNVAYQGAGPVIEEEKKYLRERRQQNGRPQLTEENGTGLAISGGGIRSATFALGAMQALARHGILKKIDYLSTVSGGGYIGSSLTWLLHREWQGRNGKVRFDVDEAGFPYGTQPGGSQDSGGNTSPDNHDRAAMLQFLRQHGNYLAPGDGITLLSMLAVILRGTLLSLLIYLPLLVFLLWGLGHLQLLGWPAGAHWFSWVSNPVFIAAALGAGFLCSAVLYAILSYFHAGQVFDEESDEKQVKQNKWYRRRWDYERYSAWLLSTIATFLFLGLLSWFYHNYPAWLGELVAEKGALGAITSILGVLSAVYAFFQSGSNAKRRIPLTLIAAVGAALILFGLSLAAYDLAFTFRENLWAIPAAALTALLLGRISSLNYVSIHRYYRDRLMELYMPDASRILQGERNLTQPAVRADTMPLYSMCQSGDTEGPYHLINCNVILVQSGIPKFRGRGGDNFILSPRYCGSNATGWRKTKKYMKGQMTLSTAMAISGAAANPNCGVGGEGPTRQPLMSKLMTLLNLRLGMWAPNPDPERQPSQHANFICPGIWSLLLRDRLNEESRFLELSDGGHFENLGLYELIRRRLKLIIACDGGADPNFQFGDLANLVEKVRADFGVNIEFGDQLKRLVPDAAKGHAQSGFVSATIYYPGEQLPKEGKLILLKTTFTEGLPADLIGYKRAHPDFPDQSTADQFFDEKQFEAYRELGYCLATQMIDGIKKSRDTDLHALLN